MHASWLIFRQTLEKSLSDSATILEPGDLPRLTRETDAILERTDQVVSTLTAAAQQAHRHIDWLIAGVVALNLAFLVTLVAYARWRIVTPLVTVTDMVKRFAAGDRSVRMQNHRYDEIGELMRGFNQGAEQMENFIGEISRLAEIIEAMPDFVGIATPDGKTLYLQPGGTKDARHRAGRRSARHRHLPPIIPDWAPTLTSRKAYPPRYGKGTGRAKPPC